MAQQARYGYEVGPAAQPADGEPVAKVMLAKIGDSCAHYGPVKGMRGVVHGEGPSIGPAEDVRAVPGEVPEDRQRRVA